MAVTWKLISYPSSSGTPGSHYYAPVALAFPGAQTEFLVAGGVTASGFDPNGPDTVTALGFAYDTFGNLENSFTIDSYTVSTLNGLHFFVTQSANGGYGVYTKQDGSGHWVLERDVVTAGNGGGLSQSLSQIDAMATTDQTIEHVFVTARLNDATPTYNVAYDVFDLGAHTDTVYEQTFLVSDNSLIGSRQTVAMYTNVSESDLPAWQYKTGSGVYALASRQVNGSGFDFIHVQPYTTAGATTGTAFDFAANNTNITDINSIRFTQDTSGAATNHYYLIADEVTNIAGLGERVALHVSGINQQTPVNVVTNITTPLTAISITQQNNGDVVVGYGDTSGGHVRVYSDANLNNATTGNATPIGTFDDTTDGAFAGVRALGDGRVEITSFHTEADGVTTEYVYRIVDFRTSGQTISNSNTTVSGNDYAGTIGADTFVGIGHETGTDSDNYMGAAGADIFSFDPAADSGNRPFSNILDYDQSSGLFNLSEHDQLDVSTMTGTAFGGGQQPSALARVWEGPSGSSVLQVDPDGTANGANWFTIAQLNGVHANNFVNVVVGSSAPAGTDLAVLADAGKFGDFDNDGHADVIWRNDNGVVATWQMNGSKIANSNFFSGVDNSWHIVGIGDFNHDLHDDVLWLNDNGTLLEYQMSAYNTIGATPIVNQTAVNGGIQHGEFVAGVADFSGDGSADIIWRDINSGTVTVWNMNGATVSSSFTISGVDSTWEIVGVGDVNGDGKADVMFRNASQGVNAAWLMNGTSSPTTIFYPGVPNDWHVASMGDFNNDGTTDVFWHNDNGANAVWLLDHSGAVQSTAFFSGVGSDWHVEGVGDFNGDHKADLFWRNDAGATAIWQMDGTNVPTVGFPGGVPNDWGSQTHHFDFV